MSDDHGGLDIGPLFIGLLGIMAGMIVVATYQCITSNCFKQRQRSLQPDPERGPQRTARSQHPRPGLVEDSETPWLANGTVGTNSVVRSDGSVTTFRYKIEFGEGTCAVCICEFGEDEEVRVLPECAHLFHVECIDMWLFSHSSCPLCRTKTSLPPRHVADVLPVLH